MRVSNEVCGAHDGDLPQLPSNAFCWTTHAKCIFIERNLSAAHTSLSGQTIRSQPETPESIFRKTIIVK